MRYHFPGPHAPFPWVEVYFFTLGSIGAIAGFQRDFPHPWSAVTLGLGVALLCMTAILCLARVIWNDQPVSDVAMHTLRSEASRFHSVRHSWMEICGQERHPTWGELDRIIFFVDHPLREDHHD